MATVTKETLEKARELFAPVEGSRLDTQLSKAFTSADKLERLNARNRELMRARNAADNFMNRLANYQIDPHRDDLLEQVKQAQATQAATSAVMAPMRTMIVQAENKYNADALAAHNVAKLISDALYDAKVQGNTMRLAQRLTKYCGHDDPAKLDLVKDIEKLANAPTGRRRVAATV